jgi:hypothetical protein
MWQAALNPKRARGSGWAPLWSPAWRTRSCYRHTWSGRYPDPFEPPIEPWIRDDITAELDGIGGTPLLIGKSLGTNAAGVAVDRGLPAVWEAIDGFLDTIGWPG